MDYSKQIANIEKATRLNLSHLERVALQRLFAKCARERTGDKVTLCDGRLTVSASGGARYTAHRHVRLNSGPFLDVDPFTHWEGYGDAPMQAKLTQREADFIEEMESVDLSDYWDE